MIVRHPLWFAVGWIHAINVIADVTFNDNDAGALTRELLPLKLNAAPYLPVTHVAPVIEPVFPFPDTSTTDEPEPASNEYPATNPEGGGGVALVVAVATFEYPPRFCCASTARTRYRYVVEAASPLSVNAGTAGVPTWMKLVQLAPWQRSTRYPATALSSVDAVHARLI
jgi:hypothetical protein